MASSWVLALGIAEVSQGETKAETGITVDSTTDPMVQTLWEVADQFLSWQRSADKAAERGVRFAGRDLGSADFLARLDRLARHFPQDPPSREALLRKWRVVRELISGFEPGSEAGAASFAETRVVGVEPDCPGALPVAEGESVVWSLDAGVTSWFLVEAGDKASLILETSGSRADTRVDVYDRCNGKLMASNDDGLGLQSFVRVVRPPSGSYRVRATAVASGRRGEVRFSVIGGGPASLSGTVVEEGTGVPLSNVQMRLYTSTGSYSGDVFTQTSGSYEFSGLEEGDYFVVSEGTSRHLGELWDDLPCEPSCDPVTGDPITVSEAVPGQADFALALGSRVEGEVSEAGVGPVAGLDLRLRAGSTFKTARTDSLGRYAFEGLQPGTFFVYTEEFDGLRNEVFDDIPCIVFCDWKNGSPIPVQPDEVVDGIDFTLDRLGSLAGRVTASDTGQPIPFADVRILSPSGSTIDFVGADSQGYWSSGGLEQGSYFVRSDLFALYRNEVYDGVACDRNCSLAGATPIQVRVNEEVTGIDFALERLGWISGTLVDEVLGIPLAGLDVEVRLPDSSFVETERTSTSGYYEVGSLYPDEYVVLADGQQVYLDELWNDRPCPFGPPFGCEVEDGDRVTVLLAEGADEINFELALGGSVSGRVSDAWTDEDIDDDFVYLFQKSNPLLLRGSLGPGGYRFDGLPGGDYLLYTDVDEYLNQVWDGIDCDGLCDPFAGDPVAVQVGETTEGVDFTLTLAGGIEGEVLDDFSQPLVGVLLHIWNGAGSLVATTATDPNGRFQANLESGVYFVSTENSLGLPEELWNNIPCSGGPASQGGCDPTTGDPITVVGAQAAVSGIDFQLGSTIFADGFESGDTSAWSATVP